MPHGTRPWVAFLALLAAGCGGGSGTPARQAAADVCADAGYSDPKVKEILMIGAGQPSYLADHQLQLDEAKHAAEQKCLVAHGAAPRGGVQSRTPDWYPPLF